MRQLTRGGGDNVRVKIDIKKVVTDTLDLSRKFLENLGIRIEVDYPTQETQVICDPGQLTQVLMNLINNAADAIHGLSEKWIRLSWKQVKDNLVIRVMDSGRGIPPEILVKIMQPFFTTKELGRGAGLGLSISKAIVENHGGQLVYEEQSGHTSFRVELKVA
jgi:C4-dicarboxylate-specific signal transduction histidine kinase